MLAYLSGLPDLMHAGLGNVRLKEPHASTNLLRPSIYSMYKDTSYARCRCVHNSTSVLMSTVAWESNRWMASNQCLGMCDGKG